jgi:putative ATPase
MCGLPRYFSKVTPRTAIGTAQQLVKQTGDLPVPIHLRNAPTKLMKELGYGEEYKYAHDYNNNFADQNFYQKH